jgi:hypothetical protein
MVALFAAILAFVFFGLGITVRRWWVLLVPALLWALNVGAAALQGYLGDSENPASTYLLFWTVFVLAPAVILTALGVISGRLLQRRHARGAA